MGSIERLKNRASKIGKLKQSEQYKIDSTSLVYGAVRISSPKLALKSVHQTLKVSKSSSDVPFVNRRLKFYQHKFNH